MIVLAVSGYKDCGKTTLCRALLSVLGDMGLKIGYVKRTQECVVSGGDTDSGSVTALGCDALLWGRDSFRYESASGCNADPRTVAGAYFPTADIVILEGGKELDLPKIWVLGEGDAKPDYPGIFAVYDRYGEGDGSARYGVGETGRLASDIAAMARRERKNARVFIGDRELAVKDFITNFIGGAVRGMLRSLKGVGDVSREVRVYLREEVDDS